MEALYEEKDHAIIGTWLPLIDGNKERQNGYIKLSLCLVEPGTQTPVRLLDLSVTRARDTRHSLGLES